MRIVRRNSAWPALPTHPTRHAFPLKSGKGRKSYLGRFHRNVTVSRGLRINAGAERRLRGRQAFHRQVGEQTTMAMTATADGVRTGGMTAEERKVIFASSLGTVFE